MQLIKVTRRTTASPEVIWELWANVPERTRWDDSLEWARLDDEPFQKGARGELKLKDQPIRKFEIIEYSPNERYTDRFFIPLGGRMDWHHYIEEAGNGERDVTFRVEVGGPTLFIVGPIMKSILKDLLPSTVDKLVEVAEQK